MKKEYNVDVAIIGAGTAGLTAYRILKKTGLSVLLIEKGVFGTTCARVGCMPSKLLISAANRKHDIENGYNFGFETLVKTNFDRVFERVRTERDRFVKFTTDFVDEIPENELLKKVVFFNDDGILATYSGIKIQAKYYIIANGSKPITPILFDATQRDHMQGSGGIFDNSYMYQGSIYTNENIFDRKFRANEHIAVVGTGVIGLELGQAFDRLGFETTIFGKNNAIAQLSDPDVKAYAKQLFTKSLKHFKPNVNITFYNSEMDSSGEHFNYLYFDDLDDPTDVKAKPIDSKDEERGKDGSKTFCDATVLAVGREPNTYNLKLENTNVFLVEDETVSSHRPGQKYPCFDPYTMFCLDENDQPTNILIAGDATGQRPILHDAANEGQAAAMSVIAAIEGSEIPKRYRQPPISITFTEPGIATVGYLHRELNLDTVKTGVAYFDDQGRSRILHKNSGMIKVYADKETDMFIGAEMICIDAEHYAHTLGWAMTAGMTINQMLQMPFYHPTTIEGVRTALRDCK